MVFCAGGGHLGGHLGSSVQYHSIKYENTSLLILDNIEYVESHFSKIPENVRYHQNTPFSRHLKLKSRLEKTCKQVYLSV